MDGVRVVAGGFVVEYRMDGMCVFLCVFLCVHVMFVMIVYQELNICFRSSRQPWLTMRQPRLRRTSKDARGTSQSKRGVLTLNYPIENGIVTHWDAME